MGELGISLNESQRFGTRGRGLKGGSSWWVAAGAPLPRELAATLRARVDEGLNDAAFLEYVCGRLDCSQHAALLRLPPPHPLAAAPAPAGALLVHAELQTTRRVRSLSRREVSQPS